jgi:outer membrane murein-binding lipoprotein Lpp
MTTDRHGMTPLAYFLVAALVVAALLSFGCAHRLPNMRADEIHTRTNTLGVTATADASGIKVTDTYVTAADAKWTISFPGFDHTTTAKDYRQKRAAEDKP